MLDPLTIARAQRISGDAPIVVALSGGGDSVALLGLLIAQFGVDRLHALVVDHALREGSANDAERARGFAKEAGVAAEILTATWPNGVKRGQAAARAARYELLCARTRALGGRLITLAHTADDQIETVFMRAAAHSSWRGLAGMAPLAPAPAWAEGRNLWIARPLLKARRTGLRDYLRARRLDWIEDPANADVAFERVRARMRLAEVEAGGGDIMGVARLAARIRPHVEHLDGAAAVAIAEAVRFEDDVICLDRRAWIGSTPVRRRALSVLLASAAGAAREPLGEAVARLDARLVKSSFAGASLGGARLAVRGSAIRLDRDPGALWGRAGGVSPLAALPLKPGRQTVWDGRLEVSSDEPGWAVGVTKHGPELRRNCQRLAIAELIASGQARWLVSEHAAHLLGRID